MVWFARCDQRYYETAHQKTAAKRQARHLQRQSGCVERCHRAGKTAALSQLQETLGKEDRVVVATSISVEKNASLSYADYRALLHLSRRRT